MVFVHQVLGLLRLVLQLASQLGVLDDRELSRAHKRALILIQHLGFDSSDLEQHLLPELFDLVNFSRFDVFFYRLLFGLLLVKNPLKLVSLRDLLVFNCKEISYQLNLLFLGVYLLLQFGFHGILLCFPGQSISF